MVARYCEFDSISIQYFKTGTCLLKASNILLYYFVSIKSLLSTIL